MIVLEQLKEQVKAANATTAGASGERMKSDKDEDEEEGRLRKRVIRKSSLWIVAIANNACRLALL